MSIECYCTQCTYHNFHSCPDNGPFCDEIECKATDKQIIEWLEESKREDILKLFPERNFKK